MGKMGLTGLVQSMARELQPKNIHVAQVVIDGGIANPARPERLASAGPDGCLDPDAIAETYLQSAPPTPQLLGLAYRVTAVVGKVLGMKRIAACSP